MGGKLGAVTCICMRSSCTEATQVGITERFAEGKKTSLIQEGSGLTGIDLQYSRHS